MDKCKSINKKCNSKHKKYESDSSSNSNSDTDSVTINIKKNSKKSCNKKDKKEKIEISISESDLEPKIILKNKKSHKKYVVDSASDSDSNDSELKKILKHTNKKYRLVLLEESEKNGLKYFKLFDLLK